MFTKVPDDLPAALGDSPSFHAWLTGMEGYADQVQAFSFFPPQAAGEIPVYSGMFSDLLAEVGICPYQHQVDAFLGLDQSQNIVVATPTASGKSLTYQIPTLHGLQNDQTALYLFPTKALAHDQLEKLTGLAAQFELDHLIASYDGDTPTGKRASIRKQAKCLLTNPDMLHYGILPYHEKWAQFFSSLKYLIVDELHSYRGVMGTHVANILRRFLRIAEHYGADVQVIAASATIGNPAKHAMNLTGLEFTAIREDTSAKAAREFIFWQPPAMSQAEDSDNRRRSANTEAAQLAAMFVKAGLKSIFFCNSRKSAELLKRYALGQLSDEETEFLQTYRAGYTSEDRRRIEQGFKKGDIRVLTATSALELGVDVGGVDAVVLVGYPGSMMALWQRAGRAGRSRTRSLTLLIPGNDPLDEYYLHHPELITDGKVENAVADAFNTEIHPLHMACAAVEKPITDKDAILGDLIHLGDYPKFKNIKKRWHYQGRYPHKGISVRGTGGKRIILKDGFGKSIGISEYETALRELHAGAVYLHMGETYLVASLDLKEGVAVLLPHIEDYYTQTRSETNIDIVEREFDLYGVNVGRVTVTTTYLSYVKKRYFSEAIIDERLLDLPEVSYNTQALWFPMTDFVGLVSAADFPSGIHALEHTLIGLLPVFVLCERADVGGVSYPIYPETGEPTIFIYDGYPGGVGYTRAGTTVFKDWLTAAYDLLCDCPCKTGCPRCVLSPKCGNGNQYLDKQAAKVLAKGMLEKLESIPFPQMLIA